MYVLDQRHNIFHRVMHANVRGNRDPRGPLVRQCEEVPVQFVGKKKAATR